MSWLADVWMILAAVYSILFYVGIFAVLILTERYFIRKRSKWEWILPSVTLAIALVIILSSPWGYYTAGGYAGYTQIHQNHRIVGMLQYVNNREHRVEAIGDYVTNEGKDSQFIQLKLDERGRILESSQPLTPELIARIEDETEHLGSFEEACAEESVTYEEILQLHESMNKTEAHWTIGGFLQRFTYYGILPVLLFFMCVTERRKRKKKNALIQARLKDL